VRMFAVNSLTISCEQEEETRGARRLIVELLNWLKPIRRPLLELKNRHFNLHRPKDRHNFGFSWWELPVLDFFDVLERHAWKAPGANLRLHVSQRRVQEILRLRQFRVVSSLRRRATKSVVAFELGVENQARNCACAALAVSNHAVQSQRSVVPGEDKLLRSLHIRQSWRMFDGARCAEA